MVDILVKNQKVELKWGYKNRAYYINEGYKFTEIGDKFYVDVCDLPSNSNHNVSVICDHCGEIVNTRYYRYLNSIEKYGNYFCNHCTQFRNLSDRQDKMYNDFLNFCNKHSYKPITKKEDLQNNNSLITYECPEHGKRTITIKGMYKDQECYLCTRKLISKRWEENLSERQADLYNKILDICEEKNYELLSDINDINGYDSYIEYSCPIHGIHRMKISNMIAGKGCPECSYDKASERNRLPIIEVINRI